MKNRSVIARSPDPDSYRDYRETKQSHKMVKDSFVALGMTYLIYDLCRPK
ncbi:MAG: hypothetical protein RIF46_00060 [Cyclobacteriaceae bacterium]